MGYSTDFTGSFQLNKPLSPAHRKYLAAFAETRRMKRDAEKTEKRPDSLRKAAKLPVGPEGAYFVGSKTDFGQERTDDILNYNSPPEGQPGLWCQWVPNEDGDAIEWDGGEKFYNYVEWLEYLIENFLKRWGYVLNGEVEWFGEDRDDEGMIVVKNNVVTTKHAVKTYEPDED